MIDGLINAFNETAKEGTFIPTFIPRFCNNLQSNVDSFGKADKPLNNVEDGKTFVKPHWVDGYTKADGTTVGELWRDGDRNTGIDLTEEEGGGYFRNLLG